MSQKTETHWLHNHSGNGFPSYEIYYAWRNVHTAHHRDHWITRFGPSGKCEAGPILALSGACRWRTSVISRKKLAKDACKAGRLSIEMPYGVKAFRFSKHAKTSAFAPWLTTPYRSRLDHDTGTRYTVQRCIKHDWTMYWYILVIVFESSFWFLRQSGTFDCATHSHCECQRRSASNRHSIERV